MDNFTGAIPKIISSPGMEQKLNVLLVKPLTWEALLSMRRSKHRTLNQTQV